MKPLDRWVWLTGTTAKARRIGIEPPCGGSPNCFGAIHIEYDSPGTGRLSSQEIHLTRDEIKWVRKMLKRAMNTPTD